MKNEIIEIWGFVSTMDFEEQSILFRQTWSNAWGWNVRVTPISYQKKDLLKLKSAFVSKDKIKLKITSGEAGVRLLKVTGTAAAAGVD